MCWSGPSQCAWHESGSFLHAYTNICVTRMESRRQAAPAGQRTTTPSPSADAGTAGQTVARSFRAQQDRHTPARVWLLQHSRTFCWTLPQQVSELFTGRPSRGLECQSLVSSHLAVTGTCTAWAQIASARLSHGSKVLVWEHSSTRQHI